MMETFGTSLPEEELVEVMRIRNRLKKDAWLAKEIKQYPVEEDIKVADAEVQKIVNKICRHFKLGHYDVCFYGKGNGGRIWHWEKKIRFNHDISIATICHELTHALVWTKKYTKHVNHGGRKWRSCLARIIKYVRKKNYWNALKIAIN
jgi:hypothetical protein